MKKLLLVMCCLFLITLGLSAQWINPSLESALTSGLFGNEIDDAFNASPGFGNYDQQFIYGGLGNPYATTSDPAGGFHFQNGTAWITAMAMKTFANKDEPIGFGYYRPGKLPMSFFIAFGGEAFNSAALGNTTKTTYKWENNEHKTLVSTDKTSSTWTPLFKNYSLQLQYLIGFGAEKKITTGLYFALESDNQHYAKTDFVKTVFKDLKDPTRNFTEIKRNDNAAPKSFDNKFTIGIPVALTTGNLSHTAVLAISSDLTNKNYYYYKETNDNKEKAI